ncbi:MAG: hypothetical protein Greene07144_977, partial [Parcubacteria group bacterium Greene0714_4]
AVFVRPVPVKSVKSSVASLIEVLATRLLPSIYVPVSPWVRTGPRKVDEAVSLIRSSMVVVGVRTVAPLKVSWLKSRSSCNAEAARS